MRRWRRLSNRLFHPAGHKLLEPRNFRISLHLRLVLFLRAAPFTSDRQSELVPATVSRQLCGHTVGTQTKCNNEAAQSYYDSSGTSCSITCHPAHTAGVLVVIGAMDPHLPLRLRLRDNVPNRPAMHNVHSMSYRCLDLVRMQAPSVTCGMRTALRQHTSSISTGNIAPCQCPSNALHSHRMCRRELCECLQSGVYPSHNGPMHRKRRT